MCVCDQYGRNIYVCLYLCIVVIIFYTIIHDYRLIAVRVRHHLTGIRRVVTSSLPVEWDALGRRLADYDPAELRRERAA